MSLRAFHLLFIFLVILGADLFGIWAVRQYIAGGDPFALVIGVLAILGGLGLILYAVRLVKQLSALKTR